MALEAYLSSSPLAPLFRVQTKADRSAAELAQALRRERAAQGNAGNAQAEAEELKEELGRMMEAFARSGTVYTAFRSYPSSVDMLRDQCFAIQFV